MYSKHHTDAVVLAARNVGEASRVLCLFTRELGMVHAHAQGVRLARSKLRSHLQSFSRVRISLVRGRETWRVVGAEDAAPVSAPSFPRIARLLRRLIHGEEADPALFDLAVSGEEELTLVARILARLGYLAAIPVERYALAAEVNRALRESQL